MFLQGFLYFVDKTVDQTTPEHYFIIEFVFLKITYRLEKEHRKKKSMNQTKSPAFTK